MIELVDTHAHLGDCPDIAAVMAEALQAGISAIIGVGLDIPSNQRTLEIAEKYPGFVFPAIGWYPDELDAAKVDENLTWLDASMDKAVAMGEIGLDYLSRVKQKVPKELQKSVLAELLNIAKAHGKPVLLHTRYAWKDALNITLGAGIEKAVFHSFTGPNSVLQGVLEAGYYVSVTPAVAYNTEMQRVVQETPLHNLLLETDCPIVFVENRTGREPPATPADVVKTLHHAAEIKGISQEELAAVTTANANKLFEIA